MDGTRQVDGRDSQADGRELPAERRTLPRVTHRPAATAPPAARFSPTSRAARAAAICLLTVPSMLLAHLVTARTVPAPPIVVLLGVVVFVVTAATGTRSRWRLALVVGLAQVAGHGLLAVVHPSSAPASSGGCLPMVGRGAEFGLRLALLRHDTACPQGSVAAGPTTTAALAGLLTAALILAAHSVIALLAAALVTAGEVAVRTLRSCAALVRPVQASPAVPVPAPVRVVPAPLAGRPVHSIWTARPARRRGPPAPRPPDPALTGPDRPDRS